MATENQSKFIPVREEDLDELKDLHRDLQTRADHARENGQLFMLQQYIRLISLVTPEIHRVERRFSRETLASLRKSHKDMKKSQGDSNETPQG